jgi:hypothetical protein
MFRWLKALALTLSLAALSIFAGCGSGNNAKIRVVHALSDANALDVDVNGTKYFTDITFDQAQPTPPAYTSVPSGSVTITAFGTGTTSPTILTSTGSFSSSAEYTVVLDGFTANATAVTIPDNNTVPTTGDVEFRVINASPSGPNSVDVYILPNPSPGDDGVSANITALANQQASSYLPLNYTANGYNVIVTVSGNKTPIVNQNYTVATGTITTLVLLDNQGGGNGMSDIPLVLNDLQ